MESTLKQTKDSIEIRITKNKTISKKQFEDTIIEYLYKYFNRYSNLQDIPTNIAELTKCILKD